MEQTGKQTQKSLHNCNNHSNTKNGRIHRLHSSLIHYDTMPCAKTSVHGCANLINQIACVIIAISSSAINP